MVNLQILDISTDDLEKNENEKEFIITLYGKTEQDEKIVCHVKGFEPFFFIKVPKAWSANIRPKINDFLGFELPNRSPIKIKHCTSSFLCLTTAEPW